MSNRWRHISSAPVTRHLSRLLLLSSLLGLTSLVACSKPDEPDQPTDERVAGVSETIVYVTDTTEWRVKIFKEHILYSEVASITLPAPWVLPTREDAAVLRLLEYPHEERFVTCDGYTFGMPSASVSKAGTKTKYSVLGLWRHRNVIYIEF